MATVTLSHGEQVTMEDYTPSSGAVTAGEFVLLGSVTANTAGTGALLAVSHKDIANNTLGAVAIGGGVYTCQVASNYTKGVKLYKPSGNSILTTTSTNNAQAGYLLEDSAAANTVCKFIHAPYA